MDVNKTVNDFLRDAQYRIAELSVEINAVAKGDDNGLNLSDTLDIRSQLIMFMDIIYEGYSSIYDGYNYAGNWTDIQIVEECEYLRYISGMNLMPYLSFAASEVSFAETEGGGGEGNDSNAIHTNIAAEISGVPSKITPSSSDYLLIEDAADLYKKKKILISSIGASSGSFPKRYFWTATADQTDFIIPGVLANEVQFVDILMVNGSVQREVYYNVVTTVVANDTIRFLTGIEAGKEVWVQYYTELSNLAGYSIKLLDVAFNSEITFDSGKRMYKKQDDDITFSSSSGVHIDQSITEAVVDGDGTHDITIPDHTNNQNVDSNRIRWINADGNVPDKDMRNDIVMEYREIGGSKSILYVIVKSAIPDLEGPEFVSLVFNS